MSIPYRERKQIDVDPGKFSQGCFEVSCFMIELLRHDDTLHRDLTTWQNCLSQGLRVLRNGQLKLGSPSWPQEDDRRKGFSTAGTLIFPNMSCIPEQSRDIQEVLALVLHCKTMYCYRTTSPSRSTTSGTLTTCTPSWIDSRRKKSQKRQAVIVFHSREPDVRESRSGRSSTRSG